MVQELKQDCKVCSQGVGTKYTREPYMVYRQVPMSFCMVLITLVSLLWLSWGLLEQEPAANQWLIRHRCFST